ncbi:MAG: hypothetical protein IKM21_02380 [Oscillospiraceae bacterium]|nr:hypothetical protein [Oscillospiraceae bacterium]
MKYYVTEDIMYLEDVGKYKSYGIELREGECVIEKIRDIDISREGVEELYALCNKLELSPIHFRDVIEDYISR